MSDLDDRIHAALNALAGTVGEHDLAPAAAPSGGDRAHRRGRARWATPLLAAAAVVAVVAGSTALLRSSSGNRPAGTTPHVTAPHVVTPTPTPNPTAPTAHPTSPPARLPLHGLVPLWPFATLADATRWETVDGPAGHAPWHADSAATALLFTRNELGFADITTVTSAVIDAHGDAHVGVGYLLNGQPRTAAVLHLARYSTDPRDAKAPWEVIGSDDTTLTVQRPAYGDTVSSPMTVGGRITGVDEDVTVTVRTMTGTPETVAPLPAGGIDTPWSLSVPFGAHGILIIVASTGGHVTQHERFAIQAARTA